MRRIRTRPSGRSARASSNEINHHGTPQNIAARCVRCPPPTPPTSSPMPSFDLFPRCGCAGITRSCASFADSLVRIGHFTSRASQRAARGRHTVGVTNRRSASLGSFL